MATQPNISSLDFDEFKKNLKSFFKRQDSPFRDWDFDGSGLNMLLNVLAYNTHFNAMLAHMSVNESFLDTAQVRENVVSHAKLLGYLPRSIRAPRAALNVTFQANPNSRTTSLTLPRGTEFSTAINDSTYTFVTTDSITMIRSSDDYYRFVYGLTAPSYATNSSSNSSLIDLSTSAQFGAPSTSVLTSTTQGSVGDTITVTSVTGISVGMGVYTSSIPFGTTITGISGTTLTLSANSASPILAGTNLIIGQWVGKAVYILAGTGAGSSIDILGHTATTLYFSYTQKSAPDSTSRYIIYNRVDPLANKSIIIAQGSLRKLSFTADSSQTSQKFTIDDTGADISTLAVRIFDNANTTSAATYVPFTSLASTTSTSQVYFISQDTTGKYVVTFGDDVIGKKLTNMSVVELEFISTQGKASNGATDFTFSGTAPFDTDVLGNQTSVSTVAGSPDIVYLYPASSGADEESIESVRFNAPNSLITQNRAVTANDYQAIIQKEFGSVDAINVWGGEDEVKYDPSNSSKYAGQAYICIKPTGADTLTQAQKDQITSILDGKRVFTIKTNFVEPDYVNLFLDVYFKYATSKTTYTKAELEALVRQAIQLYNNDNLVRFDGVLRYSNVLESIDNVDPSILNSYARVFFYKNYAISNVSGTNYVTLFNTKQLAVNFGNAIYGNVDQVESMIYSDGFLYDPPAISVIGNANSGSLTMTITSSASAQPNALIVSGAAISGTSIPSGTLISAVQNSLVIPQVFSPSGISALILPPAPGIAPTSGISTQYPDLAGATSLLFPPSLAGLAVSSTALESYTNLQSTSSTVNSPLITLQPNTTFSLGASLSVSMTGCDSNGNTASGAVSYVKSPASGSALSVVVGMTISGGSFSGGTYITGINITASNGLVFTLSTPTSGTIAALASTVGANYHVSGPSNQLLLASTTGLVPGMMLSSISSSTLAIPNGTYIKTISGNIITISANLIATIVTSSTSLSFSTVIIGSVAFDITNTTRYGQVINMSGGFGYGTSATTNVTSGMENILTINPSNYSGAPIIRGMKISGANIPANTYIVFVTENSAGTLYTVTLSNNATGASSSVTITTNGWQVELPTLQYIPSTFTIPSGANLNFFAIRALLSNSGNFQLNFQDVWFPSYSVLGSNQVITLSQQTSSAISSGTITINPPGGTWYLKDGNDINSSVTRKIFMSQSQYGPVNDYDIYIGTLYPNLGKLELITYQRGLASAVTSTSTLTDSSKVWYANQFNGCTAYIINGMNAGTILGIASNTLTTLTFSGSASLPFDTTSEYIIFTGGINADISNSRINVFASPNSDDVAPNRHQLLRLDMTRTSVTGDIDQIAARGAAGANSYITTPRNRG